MLAATALAAEDESPDSPRFTAANAAYVNAKHALMSESLEGIRAFARLAMLAARNLQDQAIEMGNDTLANYAQGAYNSSKRASMSESVEQARSYTEQAVAFAQNARTILAETFRDVRDNAARTSLTNDMHDSARETYEHGRPKESLTAF
jgi:hypothetical protein